MFRWLLLFLFIYLIIKLIQGPKRRRNPQNRFDAFFKGSDVNGKKQSRIDHIEEAEFEDITDKEKKNDNS